jgi:hypothetical protein
MGVAESDVTWISTATLPRLNATTVAPGVERDRKAQSPDTEPGMPAIATKRLRGTPRDAAQRSPAFCDGLARCTRSNEGDDTRTTNRPYRWLIHSHRAAATLTFDLPSPIRARLLRSERT